MPKTLKTIEIIAVSSATFDTGFIRGIQERERVCGRGWGR